MNLNLDLAINLDLSDEDLKELGMSAKTLKPLLSSAGQKQDSTEDAFKGLVLQLMKDKYSNQE